MFMSVKIYLFTELFAEEFGGMKNRVILHSLLRNTVSLSNIKKEFFERFYINRQVVQEAVNFLGIRKLTG